MTKMLTLIAVALFVSFPGQRLFAQAPNLINYQGRLEQNGSPITGTRNLTFSIHASPFSAATLWSETQSNVQVTNGVFNVLLGSQTPFPSTLFTGSGSRYLAVRVGTTTLSPRSRFASVPYALRSGENVIEDGDNVGIGTASPQATLEIAKAGEVMGLQTFVVNADGESDDIAFDVRSKGVGDPTASDSKFIIKGDGNVGIGTTSPQTTLHVNHPFGATNGLTISNDRDSDRWHWYVLSGNDLFLYFNGQFRGSFDDVSGNYTSSSDRRLKENIEPIEDILQKVMRLEPKKYHFIQSRETDKKYYGLIAQDLSKVFPELVSIQEDDGDGIQGLQQVSYTELIPVIIKALQEQQNMIEVLEKRIDVLESK